MSTPTLVLVAHGTRRGRGVEMIAALAESVGDRGVPVRVAFVDVLGPSPAEVLRDLPGSAVVVPAFLASGYHVHTDVPREVSVSVHPAVTVTEAMGPSVLLTQVVRQRLREAGWRRGDTVVLAAAGSSDPRAVRDVERATTMLSESIGRRVEIGYVATGEPRVPDVVARVRRAGARRVFIASYLLAQGLFHERLAEAGADGVAEPIGVHGAVVDLILARYLTGSSLLSERVAVALPSRAMFG